MRISLFLFSLAVSFAALAYNVADACISFSTTGPDRYADGTMVLDGELYALVWSQDGIFNGFTAGGKCVDAADRIVLLAPVAKDGRCPEVLFQIPVATAEELEGGVYEVYIIDTRVSAADGGVCPMGSENGRIVLINGYGAAGAAIDIKAANGPNEAMESDEGGAHVAATAASVPGGCRQPKVKNMRIEGEWVYLTVENLEGYMRVQNGSDVKAGDSTGAAVKTGGSDSETVLVAPKRGKSGFYKVIRNN
jgi:hypothetical protein